MYSQISTINDRENSSFNRPDAIPASQPTVWYTEDAVHTEIQY